MHFPNANNSRMAEPRLEPRQAGTVSLLLYIIHSLQKAGKLKTNIPPPYLIFHRSLELWYLFSSKLFMADDISKDHKFS